MFRDLSQLLYSAFRRLTVSASSKRNQDDGEQLMNHMVYENNRTFISDNEIFKRDSCTDAFGTGWSANICTPGTTLCCVNPSQNVPLCQQDLGIGWCCTADGGCYADLASACGQPGAVSCSDLGEGVSEACCPQYTTCAEGYNATTQWVRCNIQQTALNSLGSSQGTLSGASTASSTVSLELSTSTAALSSTTSSSSPSVSSSSVTSEIATSTSSAVAISAPQASLQLSRGAIAGVAIGAAAGGVLLAVLAWYMWHYMKSRDTVSQAFPEPQEQGMVQDHKTGLSGSKNLQEEVSRDLPEAEMAGSEMRSPVELSSERI